jgi:hypothetical protein
MGQRSHRPHPTLGPHGQRHDGSTELYDDSTGIAGHHKVIVNPEHAPLVERLRGMLEMEFGPMRSIMNESA